MNGFCTVISEFKGSGPYGVVSRYIIYQVMYNKAEMIQLVSDSTAVITSCCPYV